MFLLENIMAISLNDSDHIQGPINALIELVEYGDYECPYCSKAYYIVKQIQKELGCDLKFVFRNFPLTEMHPYALHAAIAAEAAAAQGKFWEMHDILFENQEHLDDSYLLQYAKAIGLDIKTFEEAFDKDEYYQKIKNDYSSGIDNGVEGTPTFYVNGKIYKGDWMDSKFLQDLKEIIRR